MVSLNNYRSQFGPIREVRSARVPLKRGISRKVWFDCHHYSTCMLMINVRHHYQSCVRHCSALFMHPTYTEGLISMEWLLSNRSNTNVKNISCTFPKPSDKCVSLNFPKAVALLPLKARVIKKKIGNLCNNENSPYTGRGKKLPEICWVIGSALVKWDGS